MDYKKAYEEEKRKVELLIKNKKWCPQRCKYCKEWYDEVIQETKKIKNKKQRDNMITLWKTLWLNNEINWDIIAHEFQVIEK